MKKANQILVLTTLLIALLVGSCRRSKEGLTDNEEELVTTLKLTFTPVGGGSASVFIFRDLDGPGGATPDQFDRVVLNANSNYSVNTQFLNETGTPAEDITLEVLEEGDDHQVFYLPAGVNMTFGSYNPDANSLPIGTNAIVATGSASTGSLRVVLKHKPGSKQAGDDVNAGETDVDITFNASIQ